MKELEIKDCDNDKCIKENCNCQRCNEGDVTCGCKCQSKKYEENNTI